MENPKIAIVGLCRRRSVSDVIKRNNLIGEHIKTKLGFDNLVFFDIGFGAEVQREIVDSSIETTFINVWDNPSDRLSAFFKKNTIIGYEGMCLFYAMEIYRYLEAYDYCIRLDSDSFVRSDFDIDQFIEGGYTFGYIRDKKDPHLPTRTTFPDMLKRYMRDNNLTLQWDLVDEPGSDMSSEREEWEKDRTYLEFSEIAMWHHYSNFSITRLDFWRNPSVQHYLEYVYQAGGILSHRWGDHVIMSNALRMFCPKEKIVKLTFKYEHGSHNWKNYKTDGE